MSTYLSEILKKLGWEDGFQIPVANAENQKLEEEVARLTLQKVKAKTNFENSCGKLENLEAHLKYINQESEQNQNLITAHAQQLNSEENSLQLSQAEKAKYEHDIKDCEKKLNDVNDRVESKKMQLQKSVRKLDKLKTETDWDTEALKAWEESLQKRDDDNELIKKFSKQDEQKYNELEARRQNLEKEYTTRKHTIHKMVCDLNNYERMLERTGKIMKQQVVERDALIQQWKDSVKILKQRDIEIDRLQVVLGEMQEIIEKEQEKLQEQKKFYEHEIRNNHDTEHEVQQLNFLNSRMRRELNELLQYELLLNSQVDTVRRTMINTAHHLEKQRASKKNVNEQIAKMQEKIEKYQQSLLDLKRKDEELKQCCSSIEDKMKHLEKLIDYEQKQQKALQNDNEILQNTYFRVQQEMQEENHTGKVIELEILGMTNNINHLRKHNNDQKKVIGKKKEDAYELDFKIDEIQRKILIKENVIHNEDAEELELKLLELQTKMDEHNEIKNLLKDQVNKIRDDMKRLTTAILNDQNQLSDLKDKLQHQNLNYEGGQKQLQTLKTQIQENQVEESILRLRVDQLRKAMKKQEKSIFTLKRFKLTLEQATRERLLEIETKKEILLVKRRNLREDKGRLKADISERLMRLDQFKKKYDIILMSLGKDEEGQTLTITHFKIKNAQEKYLLQKEGDDLDTKIKKAEKEILAMENTLKVVNLTNAAFKQSLAAVDEDGEEICEMKALEDQLLTVNDLLREQRKKFAAKKQELEEAKMLLKEIEMKCTDVKERLIELEDEYYKIHKERMLKEEKLKRANACLKTVEKKISEVDREKYDRDLQVRQLKDANICVMQRLVEMSIRCHEVGPLITRYTLEYGIKLPEKRTLSTLSTSTESTRSSASCSKQSSSNVSSSGGADSKTSTPSSSRNSGLAKVEITFQI